MRKSLFAILGVALFAAVVYLLKSGDESTVEISKAPDTAAETPSPPDAVPSPQPPAPIREEVVQARAPGEPPASYVAALGGITGRVVDAEGQPMTGFPVDLVGSQFETLLPPQDTWLEKPDFDLELDRKSVHTDAAGRFRIAGVDPAAYHLFQLGRGTNREKWDVCLAQPEPGKDVDVGDLKLDEYAVLTGRVVDAKGAPLAGARVRASELPAEFFKFGGDRLVPGAAVAWKEPGKDWRAIELPRFVFRLLELLPYRETESGADGTFRLEGVPLGMLSVVADGPGYLLALRSPVNTKDGGEKEIGDVKLTPGETLEGRVIDGSDQPVANAKVLAGPVFPFFPVALMAPLGPTGADGAFSGDGFSDESLVVAARRADASKFVFAEDVVAGIDEPELRVDETTTLTVRVRDQNGDLVRAPRIFVQQATEMSEMTLLQPPLDTSARTTFNEDGSVEVAGLSREKFNVFARKDGFAVAKVEADLADGPASVEITLKPERVATVRVVEKSSGKPIEYALVLGLDREGEGDGAGPIPIAPIAYARTDEHGLAVLKGIDEGKQFVRAAHPSYAAVDGELTESATGITLELPQGGTLRGRLLRDGVPIKEPHFVVAFGDGADGFVLPRVTMATDANGEFEMSRIPAGSYLVMAAKSLEDMMMSAMGGPQAGMMFGSPMSLSSLPFLIGASSRSAPDDLEPPEDAAESSAESSGEPAPPRRSGVRVTVKTGESTSAAPAPQPAEPEESAPDATGAAAAEGEPHEYEDVPQADPGYRAIIKDGQVTTLEIDLSRLPGDFDKARLSGLVTVNGAPRKDLVVHAEHRGNGAGKSERTLDNGRFDLGEVPAGALDVSVAFGKGDQLSYLLTTKATLEPNETRQLDLRVEAGSLEGSVRAASDRRALAEATVRLLPLDAKGHTNYEGCFLAESTATDGSFRFEIVPEGDYKLEVTREGFSAAATDKLRVPARGLGPRHDFALLETVPVKGRVELPPGVTKPEMLFVRFPSAAEIDFAGFVFVDPESGEFKLDAVAPGDYDVEVYGAEAELEPVKVHVPPQGLQGCVLRPVLKPPPKPAGG